MKKPFRPFAAIILLVYFLSFAALAQAQKKPAKKGEEPQSMEEMMKQLQKEMEADPETKKAMEEMGITDMLKQVEKTTKEAEKKGVDVKAMTAAPDPNKIPDRPSGLPIAATPAGKEQVKAYLQPLMQSTNAAIKPNHKADITKHLNKGKETGVIAMAYFTNREMDKALYLLLNACLTDQEDYASMNNLGAFLTISGYAHKSLPLLQYVQKHFPQSPTLLNNLGQAWLSLGYLDKADKFLKDALKEDKSQTQASYSLAVMAKHQGNKAKCIDYVKQTIENGGDTPDALSMLANEEPGTDIAAMIRAKYKPYYKKDHAITKRFRVPPIPGSYAQAIASYQEVETFFQDMHHTVNKAVVTASEMEEALEQQRMKIYQNQTRDLTNLMKTPGDQGALLRHHLKYNHPLRAQATIMLASMYKSDYSTSFEARLRREKDKRVESDKQLLQSLEGIQKKISALHKEAGKLEGGENGAEELQAEKLLDQACALGQDYQAQLLAGRAAIGDLYIHNMEDLLNQKLQEEIFWSLVLGYPADPTASVYSAYASYLKEINSFRTLYPDPILLSPPCKEDYSQLPPITGKLQQWEADHCNISWGFDVKVFKGRFDCNGMKMQVNYGPLSAEYGVSQDPATWDITSHTVSVEAGAKKEFDVGKTLTGEIGATAGGSVTFDSGGNVVDAGVKGSVGAGVSGPMGGGAGVQVGSVEVTMSGGFNSSGPSANSPGSSFLRGN